MILRLDWYGFYLIYGSCGCNFVAGWLHTHRKFFHHPHLNIVQHHHILLICLCMVDTPCIDIHYHYRSCHLKWSQNNVNLHTRSFFIRDVWKNQLVSIPSKYRNLSSLYPLFFPQNGEIPKFFRILLVIPYFFRILVVFIPSIWPNLTSLKNHPL